MPFSHRRACALLMLSLFSEGCTVWRPAPEPPRPFLEHDPPPHIRVLMIDGTASEVEQPVLVGDEIRGFDPHCWDPRDHPRTSCKRDTPTVSVPVDDVRAVEVQHLDPGRIFAVTFVTVAVLYGALASSIKPMGG